jgi:uncharacterized protein (DUF849 family)
MIPLRPDMASLATGSCNFPSIIYENPPALIRELAGAMREYGVKPEIEVFDLSMLYQAVKLVDEGFIEAPLHVQFVFGIRNCMPALRQVLEFEAAELDPCWCRWRRSTARATASAMAPAITILRSPTCARRGSSPRSAPHSRCRK